jgi:adenosylcobinamide-GDP ribazoletransferase
VTPAGLRPAIAMFTAVPVPPSWHTRSEPADARAALGWLPFLGAAIGALAALPAAAVLARAPGAGLLAAVVAIAGLVLLTRGLHLDGLADTADGLGSRAPAERALEIMRQSDVGPFGVAAVTVVLLVDVAALATLTGGRTWPVAAVAAVAAATGRLAVVHAAGPGVRSARASGFGALVTGGAGRALTIATTVAVLAGGALLAEAVGASPIGWPLAQAVALAITWGFRTHVTHRLGGITGDVFGALVEVATALTLIGLVVTVH